MLEDSRLRIFQAVIEEGNFTRAARSLGITQPAVSQCIAELERETGTALFLRGRTSVSLTPEGEAFRRYAERILADYGALDRVFGPEGRLRGSRPVSLSAPAFIAEAFLPDVLVDMRAASSLTFTLLPEGEEADVNLRLSPASGTLDFASEGRLVGGLSAVALAAGPDPGPEAGLLVWAPYRGLLTDGEASCVTLVSDNVAVLKALLRRSPGSAALLPLAAAEDGLTLLPRPLPHLNLELRLHLREEFSRTRPGAFVSERLSEGLRRALNGKV